MSSSGGSVDPFLLIPRPVVGSYGTEYNNTKVKTLRSSQTVSSAVRNLILILPGQSNNENIAPSPFTPVNGSALDNLNILDGALYAATDPLLGTGNTGGNPFLRLADSFVTAGLFDRVILVPIAVSATEVLEWSSATGICKYRILVALRRLAAKGIVSGTNVTIAVLWGQGENDNAIATSQANYTSRLQTVISDSRLEGYNPIWFVAKQSWFSGSAASAVQLAQAAVVNHGSNIWAGPDIDALNGSACSGSACRQGDNTHLSDAGSTSCAAAWKTSMALYGAPFA